MSKYLKQGFVRKLEWQLAREEISHSKMVELMEEECIKNYKAEMKDVMCEFADDYQRNCFQKSAHNYFEETFNTKEK